MLLRIINCCCWIGLLSCVVVAQDKSNAEAARQPAVSELVKQLDANQFEVRERATEELKRRGVEAIPAIIAATHHSSLEQGQRCMAVLESYLTAEDPQLNEQTEAALMKLAQQESGWAAQRAQNSLRMIRTMRQPLALQKLRTLGATIAQQPDYRTQGEQEIITVILDAKTWKGTEKDFELLRRIPDLRSVNIFGELVKEEQLVALREIKELEAVNLYGTRLSDNGLKQLQEKLGDRVLRRNGGMLGISGDQGSVEGCMVNTVQPKSAAENAGLIPGDLIVKIDNQKIETFRDLTTYIATKSGGDKVSVEYLREGKSNTTQAQLDQWKPEHLQTNLNNGNGIIINGGRVIIGR
jgi:hypothetical protein